MRVKRAIAIIETALTIAAIVIILAVIVAVITRALGLWPVEWIYCELQIKSSLEVIL